MNVRSRKVLGLAFSTTITYPAARYLLALSVVECAPRMFNKPCDEQGEIVVEITVLHGTGMSTIVAVSEGTRIVREDGWVLLIPAECKLPGFSLNELGGVPQGSI